MSESIKYKSLMFIRYLGDSFFYPFFALFLQSAGLIKAEIGFVLSISPFLGILLNPLYAKFANSFKKLKNTLGVISILEALMIFLIAFLNNFLAISIVTCFIALFGACHYGLMDSFYSLYVNSSNGVYSKFRIFGSISYIIGTSLGGVIIKKLSFYACFGFSFLLFVLSGILYFLIKIQDVKSNEIQQEKGSFKNIFQNKTYLIILLFYVFALGSLRAGDEFLSVYLSSRKITESQYGFIYSYFVIVEVVTLLILAKKDKNVKFKISLLIASILIVIRNFVICINAPLLLLVFLTACRGVAFAFILHSIYTIVTKTLTTKYATKGIMFMTMCYAIFICLFNNINGFLIDLTKSYKWPYLILTLMSIVSVFLALVFLKKERNKKNEYVSRITNK